MALNIKTGDSYGFSLLPLFGVDPLLAKQAAQAGVLLDQSSPGNFTVTHNGVTYGSIPVKGQAISLAKAGQLGPASKQAWKYQFEQALNKAIAVHHEHAGPIDISNTPPLKFDLGIEPPLPKSTPKIPSAPAEPTSPKESIVPGITSWKKSENDGAIMKMQPVALQKATKCLQPVFGTSSGSIYYVIAMFTGANLAARIKGQRLSLRMEGAKLNMYAPQLNDLGFSVKDTYGSVHFDTNQLGLILKTVGAVIGRLGFTNLVDAIDPHIIIGK